MLIVCVFLLYIRNLLFLLMLYSIIHPKVQAMVRGKQKVSFREIIYIIIKCEYITIKDMSVHCCRENKVFLTVVVINVLQLISRLAREKLWSAGVHKALKWRWATVYLSLNHFFSDSHASKWLRRPKTTWPPVYAQIISKKQFGIKTIQWGYI